MPRVISLLCDKAAYSERDHAYAMQSISDNPTLNPQNVPTRNHPLAFEAASTVHAHITNRALSKPHPPSLNLTVRNGRGTGDGSPFAIQLMAVVASFAVRFPCRQRLYTGLSKKNPAKFGDTFSVRADELSIGCLVQWAERGQQFSNMQEFFCTTL